MKHDGRVADALRGDLRRRLKPECPGLERGPISFDDVELWRLPNAGAFSKDVSLETLPLIQEFRRQPASQLLADLCGEGSADGALLTMPRRGRPPIPGDWTALWMARVATDFVRALMHGTDRLLRKAGLRKPKIYADAGTATAEMKGFSTGYATIGESASVEDKISFLLRAHGEQVTQLQLLDRNVTTRLESLRDEIRDDITAAIHRLQSDSIHVRRAGVAFVIVGIVLLALAPFV